MVTQLVTQIDELRMNPAVAAVLGLPVVGSAVDEVLTFTDFVGDTRAVTVSRRNTPAGVSGALAWAMM